MSSSGWAYFFRETKNLDVVPPPLAERPFHDALDVARTATFRPEEWEAYERAKMAEQDARGALVVARREGVESGLAQGTAEATLTVLAARGIAVDSETRARIVECTDAAALTRWLARAVTADSAAEVIDSA